MEEVVKDYPILLNRAPTLHRLGIQAFMPSLVEGDAIQIHPLVCEAFNADFDGDQMAVHIPLSEAAKAEARLLMLSSRNLLRPANGEPIVGPSKDMVLGCYYLTMAEDGEPGEGKWFGNLEDVVFAYESGHVALHAKIKLYYLPAGKKKRVEIETTVGRCIFNEMLPEEIRFVNETMDKGKLKNLIGLSFYLLGAEATAPLVDDIKEIGFKYATRSGLTIALSDINVPESKQSILDSVSGQVGEVDASTGAALSPKMKSTSRRWSCGPRRPTTLPTKSRKLWIPRARYLLWRLPARRKVVFSPFASWPECVV